MQKPAYWASQSRDLRFLAGSERLRQRCAVTAPGSVSGNLSRLLFRNFDLSQPPLGKRPRDIRRLYPMHAQLVCKSAADIPSADMPAFLPLSNAYRCPTHTVTHNANAGRRCFFNPRALPTPRLSPALIRLPQCRDRQQLAARARSAVAARGRLKDGRHRCRVRD